MADASFPPPDELDAFSLRGFFGDLGERGLRLLLRECLLVEDAGEAARLADEVLGRRLDFDFVLDLEVDLPLVLLLVLRRLRLTLLLDLRRSLLPFLDRSRSFRELIWNGSPNALSWCP